MNAKTITAFVFGLVLIPNIAFAWLSEDAFDYVVFVGIFFWSFVALVVVAIAWDVYKNKNYSLLLLVGVLALMLSIF